MSLILRSFVHSVLAVLFLLQAISTTAILVNFELNREEIAKTLCVKKEEKGNCCQGSCNLKKQLQAEEKQQQAPGSNFKQIKQFPLFHHTPADLIIYSDLLTETDFIPFRHSKLHTFTASVFHPPCPAA